MSDHLPAGDDPRREAEAWAARLGQLQITTPELHRFRAWLREPANRLAWDALEAGRHPVDRFVVRPEIERFKVVDTWTGETAVIAMTAQDGLSEEDARHTARLLNGRAAGGDRSVLQ
jgi:ferric-dicitrate binding protein FerR (iron transport regulator)